MKKQLLSLLAFAAALIFTPNVKASNSNVPNRNIYAFFLRNTTFDNNGYGYGKFTTQDTNPELFYPWGDSYAIYGGAAVDGVFYGAEYWFSLSDQPTPKKIISYNIYTKEFKELCDWAESETSLMRFGDWTYDVSTKTMYATTYNMGEKYLQKIDLETGKMTQITKMDDFPGALSADKSGNLYGICQDGWLYKIDKTNGKFTRVYNTGYNGMVSGQTMEFDKTNGDLYWASSMYSRDGGRESWLVRFQFNEDGTVKSMDELNTIGSGAAVLSMYIPYVEAGDDAPAAPTEIKAVPAGGGEKKATITWKNPTKTFGGEDLASIEYVTVERDGEIVKTFTTDVAPGQEMSYVDETPEIGKEYKYEIYAANEVGDGEKGLCYQYVGMDVPEAPRNLFIKLADGCGSTTISWDAPEIGKHGLPIDQSSIKYDVVRQPDKHVVGTDLTETSVTDDNIRRLGKYYYEVTAKNDFGSTTGTTVQYVFGKAITVDKDTPFTEDFSNEQSTANKWTAIDGNEDGWTWTFNTTAAQYLMGDEYIGGAEYYIHPQVTPSEITATDEWLLLPPICFDDEEYVLQIVARNLSTENLTVTSGKRNLKGDQQTVKELTLEASVTDDDGYYPFSVYNVDIPKGEGINCLGLHLTTPINAERYSFFQISEINILAKSSTGINNAISDNSDLHVSKIGDEYVFSSNVNSVVLYNINGETVRESKGNKISVANLSKSVYIMTAKSAAKSYTTKICIQ